MTTDTRPRILRTQPDDTYLTDLAARYTELLDKTQKKFITQDGFYGNTYKVWPNNTNRTNYYTGAAAATIRQAVDTQFTYVAKVHREPVGDAEKAKELADEVEKWMENLFDVIALDTHTPPIKMFNFHLVLHGKGILEGPRFLGQPNEEEDPPKREPDEDAEDYDARVAAWEYESKHWNPFTMRAPHPGTILCDPWVRNPDEVIVRKMMRAYQLAELTERRRRLGGKVDLYTYSSGKGNETVVLDEYFSRYWHIMKIKGGELLIAERNQWLFVPFQQMYSTFGWEQTDESLNDPEDLCGGLLDNVQDVIRSIDQNASAAHEVNIRKAYASRIAKGSGAQVEEALRATARGEDSTGLGKDDISILEYPDVPVSLREEQDRLQAALEQGTYTPALLGIHQAGVKTLGEATINSRAASRKFQAIAQADASGATVIGENVLRMMDIFGHPVTMRGVTIDRKHIGHVYALDVTFDNADFLTQQQERADAREDYKNGLIDDELTLRKIGEEDVSGIRERKIMQLARQDPRYIRKLVDGALAKLGMDEAELAEAQQPPQQARRNGGGPMLLGPDGQPMRAVQQAGQLPNGRVAPEQIAGAMQPLGGGA